jgi:hypothetical protein
MNYRQTAMRVAANKAKRPEIYCPASRCLWRTAGGYCPRHKREEREPECTCVQVDVDLFDARHCEAHGGNY